MTTTLVLRMETSIEEISFDDTLKSVNEFFKMSSLSPLLPLDTYELTGVLGEPGVYVAFGLYKHVDVLAFVEYLRLYEWQNDGGVVELVSFEDGKATVVHTVRGEKQFQLLSWYAADAEGDPDGEQTCALAEDATLDDRAISDPTECGQFISLRVGSPRGWPTCGECSASLLKKMREGKL